MLTLSVRSEPLNSNMTLKCEQVVVFQMFFNKRLSGYVLGNLHLSILIGRTMTAMLDF